MKMARWTFSALVLSQLFGNWGLGQYVYVNQAGYLTDQPKYAYTRFSDDSMFVVDKGTGAIVYRTAFVLTSAQDPSTGFKTLKGDFSSFAREGTYQILTPSTDTSYVFTISKTVYEDVYKKSLKGFYFQRCGAALLSQNAGVYARTICHVNDAVFHSSTDHAGSKVTTLGWHDAGDYGKYVVNAGISVGTLLLAYELFPSKVRYDDLNIPESGNGVPDLLDEVRFELEWFLEMQDTADGGVYFKVTTANFDAFEMPSQDVATRYIYQKSTTATGDFAAVMAQAARIYSPFDAVFSSQCLAAAQKAWQYLQSNPSIVPTGGFHNPSGTGTGEYSDGNDADERLWAAAELFVTTGADTYHNYFKSHYDANGIFSSTMGWQNVNSMAQLAYLTGKQLLADSAVKSQLQSGLTTYCNNLLAIVSSDGLNVSLLPADYGWGSNGYCLNNAVLLIAGFLTTSNHDFYVAALEQLNYILGCNRHNMTFVTGVGSARPMHPHHRPSASDGIVEPVPGLMAGGPDRYLDDSVLSSLFTSSTPPAACYVDDQGSYASNEIAINWNAPLVFVSGFFNESPAVSVAKSTPKIPFQCSLEQNFPNPFNPVTRFRYSLSNSSHVTLKVFDMLGREMATIVDATKPAGIYTVSWDASSLPSAVYFYRMQAGNTTVTKKMVLLK